MSSTYGSTSIGEYFGEQIKDLRTQRGWTQELLAEKLHYSASFIGQIENARRTPSKDLIGRAEEIFEVRGALMRLWPMLNREKFPEWFKPTSELEQNALGLQTYQAQVVYGPMQTEAYARALLSRGWPTPTEEEREERVQARLSRHELFTRSDGPVTWIVLDEAALRREIGSREVMREQLQFLLQVAQYNRVGIQVLPFSAGAHTGTEGSFTLVETQDSERWLYVEHAGGSYVTGSAKEIREYTNRMNFLYSLGLNPEESIGFIADLIGEL